MAPAQRQRVIVHGRVQGVFFRQECRRNAEARGVNGWVRNNRDGTVEAVFEGTLDGVRAMAAWMRRGPSTAVVERVETAEEPAEGLAGFDVRYDLRPVHR